MPDDVYLEPEVLEAKLKEIGCPYPVEDYRTTIWLKGFKAGCDATGKVALDELKAALR